MLSSPPGPAFILIAASLWALDGVIRRSLFTLPPVTIVFYEHLIGALILLPVMVRMWLSRVVIDQKTWGLVALIALLSGLIGTLLFTTALVATGFIAFSVVFLLQKLQPIFAIGGARLLLKEPLTPGYLRWAAVALVAAYFVTFPGGRVNLDSGPGTLMAALAALGAAAAWGSSTVFSKMLLSRVGYQSATALRFGATTVFAGIAVFIMGQSASLTAPTVSQFGLLTLIAVSTGMVALMLYYRGLAQTEAKVTTILELAFPLLAVIIDVFVYQSNLAPSQYLAALILIWAMRRLAISAPEA